MCWQQAGIAPAVVATTFFCGGYSTVPPLGRVVGPCVSLSTPLLPCLLKKRVQLFGGQALSCRCRATSNISTKWSSRISWMMAKSKCSGSFINLPWFRNGLFPIVLPHTFANSISFAASGERMTGRTQRNELLASDSCMAAQ